MAKQSTTPPKVITKKHLARVERERRQTRIIIGIAIAGIAIVLGLLAYGLLRYNVVANVNGVNITAAEWQERVKLQRVQMINMYNQYAYIQQTFGMDYSQQMQQIGFSLQSPETVGQEALDQMRDEILIRQEAKKRGITVSAEDLDNFFKDSFGFYPDGTPTPTITPTEYAYPTLTSKQLTMYPPTSTPTAAPTATLEPTFTPDPNVTSTPTATVAPASPTPVPALPTMTATPYTVEGFKTDYQKFLDNYKTNGISESTLRSYYEVELIRRKLADDLTKDMPTTEEQVLARHILVETEEEANAIYDQLKNGADFAELAKTKSKDTGSGANGGDLGWFGKGQMVAPFEEAAFSQPIGEIGKPVKSDFGYHIIQVIARQELPLTSSQIDQKKQKIYNDWLDTARGDAKYVIYDVWKERVPTEPTLGQ